MIIIHQIDYELFTFINNLAGRWSWLDGLAKLLLNDYFVPTLLATILLALWFDGLDTGKRSNRQRAVLVGALAAALVNILLKALNLLYNRPRPFELYDVNLLFYHPTDSSLPSNAAALGFAIAVGVWFYQRRWGWALLTIATLFGLSRIFGGVHYPLDVVTGAALGCVSAGVIYQQKRPVTKLLTLIVTLAYKTRLEPESFKKEPAKSAAIQAQSALPRATGD